MPIIIHRAFLMVTVLDNAKNGVCEILAIGDGDYFVIERDSKGGEMAGFKKIFQRL